MRHTFISQLAENPNVSEQTIKALAGHVSRQMMERYSHIRSQAKQAAIETLNEGAIAPVLEERRYNFRYSQRTEQQSEEANSQNERSDHHFTKRSGDMVYTSVLD